MATIINCYCTNNLHRSTTRLLLLSGSVLARARAGSVLLPRPKQQVHRKYGKRKTHFRSSIVMKTSLKRRKLTCLKIILGLNSRKPHLWPAITIPGKMYRSRDRQLQAAGKLRSSAYLKSKRSRLKPPLIMQHPGYRSHNNKQVGDRNQGS